MAVPELPPMAQILTRDFIHASLYHPHYGYFSKNAEIFTLDTPIDFKAIRDIYDFHSYLSTLYARGDSASSSDANVKTGRNGHRQTWHTPTELFRPWYGNAIASYILSRFKSVGGNLEIYEIGAGNGTLMLNILDFIRDTDPAVYRTMSYNIIEISPILAEIQRAKQRASVHRDRIQVINRSIFEWDETVDSNCFVIALEVLVALLIQDNLSHDLVRYDTETKEPLQGVTQIDDSLDFHEAFEPVSDQLLQRYMAIRSSTGYKSAVLRNGYLKSLLPIQSNLTKPEFLPTMCFSLMELLLKHFPNHNLVLSDFSSLPDTVEGVDSPVVQTRYNDDMVACSTYLVQPGWFDIFFPTNFELLAAVYKKLGGKQAQIMTHGDFLKEHAQHSNTRTKSGENPMLEYYENVKFFCN